MRLGLCCTFRDEPIKFRNTTVAAMSRLERPQALARISELCLANAGALREALQYCAQHAFGCFRVNSQILPLKSHPMAGYTMDELPQGSEIVARFRACGDFARAHDLRTCLHPDQFVVLNSPRPEVVTASLRELEYLGEFAEWIGADVLILHGGGGFGNKPHALSELARNCERLSPRVRSRLGLENDDRVYTPSELLPTCRSLQLPLVYDVHHHRCLKDALSEQAATEAAISTWNREPLFHISSPIAGWRGPLPQRHHDFIDVSDFPREWLDLELTVEVEAKAKEAAVRQLQQDLRKGQRRAPAKTIRNGGCDPAA